MPEKTYSIYAIIKLGLLMRPDGQPYRRYRGVLARLQKNNIKKSSFNPQGQACYAVTESQIAHMNKWTDLPKTD